MLIILRYINELSTQQMHPYRTLTDPGIFVRYDNKIMLAKSVGKEKRGGK